MECVQRFDRSLLRSASQRGTLGAVTTLLSAYRVMNQTQLIQSAKQHDTSAIATLLNQSLSSRRMEIIEVTIEENSLSLKLRSRRIPDQHKIIPFLTEELSTLNIPSIEQAIIYGLSEESVTPAWEQTIPLTKNCSIAGFVTKIEARPIVEEIIEVESPEKPEEVQDNAEESVEKAEEPPETAETSEEKEPERSLPSRYALPTSPPDTVTQSAASSSLVSLVVALAIGFALGMMAGMFFGYQKAISDGALRTTPTIPDAPTGTIEPTR
jgi:hypothetical protein